MDGGAHAPVLRVMRRGGAVQVIHGVRVEEGPVQQRHGLHRHRRARYRHPMISMNAAHTTLLTARGVSTNSALIRILTMHGFDGQTVW